MGVPPFFYYNSAHEGHSLAHKITVAYAIWKGIKMDAEDEKYNAARVLLPYRS